jgi:hypothetical protein
MYNFCLGRKLLSKMHLYRYVIRVKRISSVRHPFRLSNLLLVDTSTGFGSYIGRIVLIARRRSKTYLSEVHMKNAIATAFALALLSSAAWADSIVFSGAVSLAGEWLRIEHNRPNDPITRACD